MESTKRKTKSLNLPNRHIQEALLCVPYIISLGTALVFLLSKANTNRLVCKANRLYFSHYLLAIALKGLSCSFRVVKVTASDIDHITDLESSFSYIAAE